MKNIQTVLDKTIAGLSDQNYEQSFAFLRLWFEIAHTYSTIPPNAILHALQTYYRTRSFPDNLIDSAAHLVLRFAGDAESDHILAPHSTGLRSRLCTDALRVVFDTDLAVMYNQYSWTSSYFTDVNIIAHCVNLGWVEEAVIRNYILQSLISHPTLSGHQVYAFVILFKTAGATFETYADPTAIDRCFEILKGPRNQLWPREQLIQVNALCVKGVTLELRRNSRRSLSCGSVAGRVFLPHLYSKPGSQNQLVRTRKTLLRLQLSHPWDFPTEI